MYLNQIDAFKKMNSLGKRKIPFLFVLAYDNHENVVIPLSEIDSEIIKYELVSKEINFQNFINKSIDAVLKLEKTTIPFEAYKIGFDIVKNHINSGNSFLCNLTASTPINTNVDLEEIMLLTKARFKLWIKDKFVCFSPESFLEINAEGRASSFPMKGTIDAEIPNAAEIIKNDPKEKYEHNTIVDLIRNDLSMISDKVWVEKFRYIDTIIKENGDKLLQVSSEVCALLKSDWNESIGDIFKNILPAGSITGAPKSKTIEIIAAAEKKLHHNGKRNHYTGVFGIFDGKSLSSAVLIRMIENQNGQKVFKSGGGITSLSNVMDEYKEIEQKVYVPVF